jgi:ring-1,2-phenylacetyl-CoA epoxidase subunit PaaD
VVTRAADRAAELWDVLREVLDPEVPALSVVDLGIVRGIEVVGDDVTVTVTPTYSGCPATREIEREIVAALGRAGHPGAAVRTVYSPPWTTDWISDEGRRKLREYGIAPPGAAPAGEATLVAITPRPSATVSCPFCGSARTSLRSEFGSTACKAMLFCDECRQPFEAFKAI